MPRADSSTVDKQGMHIKHVCAICQIGANVGESVTGKIKITVIRMGVYGTTGRGSESALGSSAATQGAVFAPSPASDRTSNAHWQPAHIDRFQPGPATP